MQVSYKIRRIYIACKTSWFETWAVAAVETHRRGLKKPASCSYLNLCLLPRKTDHRLIDARLGPPPLDLSLFFASRVITTLAPPASLHGRSGRHGRSRVQP